MFKKSLMSNNPKNKLLHQTYFHQDQKNQKNPKNQKNQKILKILKNQQNQKNQKEAGVEEVWKTEIK